MKKELARDNKKLLFLALSIIILSVFIKGALAQEDIIPTEIFIRQNTVYDLKFFCEFNSTDCLPQTLCNATSVYAGDGTLIFQNRQATNNTDYHNITLTRTDNARIGTYFLKAECFQGTNNGLTTFSYEVTPSGTDDKNINQIVLLSFGLIFSIGLIVLGFAKEDASIAIFGGLLLFSVSLYTLLNGVASYRNTLTEASSLITVTFAAYITIRSSWEMIKDNG